MGNRKKKRWYLRAERKLHDIKGRAGTKWKIGEKKTNSKRISAYHVRGLRNPP